MRADLVPFTLMLLVLLAATINPMVSATPSAEEETTDYSGEWIRMSPQNMVPVELKPTSGVLHTTLGSFDPLVDSIPSFSYLDSVYSSNVFLIQLHTSDAMSFAALADKYSLNILDTFPDAGWLVRVKSQDSIEVLKSHSEIRWISAYPSDWKLSESMQDTLEEGIGSVNLSLVLAPDVLHSTEKQMSFEFSNLDLERTWCESGQCELWGLNTDANFVSTLAEDDRILHISVLDASMPLNSYAAQGISVDELANMTVGMNGSGEVIGVADTGIDSYHPDFDTQKIRIKSNFGLDSSSLDTNGGHGTHVVGTIIGNGTGDSEAKGLAPGAFLHFQALEHDNSGYFGRQGSLYDLLQGFYASGARTGSNSWGAPGAQGQYTSDARSVDSFANYYDDFTVLFSAGTSSSGVASPSTAKNALSIGASTSPRPGSLAPDAVWNSSASGFSADGRIKPDLVAPGIDICSTMSADALTPLGQPCASGSHSNGEPLYRKSNGSSHSTAVAAASVLLTRQFLRTEANVSAPSSDLVRATLINGAKDLGTSDVPNSREGWGQIDLVSSLHPKDGNVDLDTFYDMNISLRPGFSFIYGFDLDVSNGISITLVWTDREGSSSAAQSASRLVNDLDLLLVAPDGTTWLGNDFANGLSTTGGSADGINVVERIELPSGTTHQSGSWSIQIAHRGGLEQSFALVVAANGQHDPATDLAVFSDSIFASSNDPLVNEALSITAAWINQAPLATGSYKVKIEDITTGEVLREVTRPPTPGGKIESFSFYWEFNSTGTHTLRLTLDSNDDVAEINDENNGINNNVKEITVNVTALGLRLIPLLQDGSLPSTSNQTLAAASKEMDAQNESSINFDMILRHEGTGTESVTISTGSVRMLSSEDPNLILSSPDEWDRTLNISSPVVVSPAGQEGDEIAFSLTLDDISADTTSDVPRYAYAGTYIVDIEARYQLQPLIRHKMRLTVVVSPVAEVNIAVAGTNGLESLPGESEAFAISVRNMGNAPAVYLVECISENRWSIELGDGVSSSQEFEPLGILDYLPMQVRVRVPEVNEGLPSAGYVEKINCWVTSVGDKSLNYSIEVDMTVSKLDSFEVQMYYPNGGYVAASALEPDLSVDAGEQYNQSLQIENTGNAELNLIVYLQTSSTSWPVMLSHGDDSATDQLELSISAGSNTTVVLTAGVPANANQGDSNSLVLFTYIEGTNRILGIKNSTTFLVRKEVGIEFDCQSNVENENTASELIYMDAAIGFSSTLNCSIVNTGNAFLYLTWSVSTLDGWEMGFASAPATLDQYDQRNFFFLAKAPEGSSDEGLQVTLRVIASHSNQSVDESIVVIMSTEDSASAILRSLESADFDLLGSSAGSETEVRLSAKNIGNVDGIWIPLGTVQNDDGEVSDNWEIDCGNSEGLSIAAGSELEFTCKVKPLSDEFREVLNLRIILQPLQGDNAISSDDGVSVQVSIARTVESSGLFAGLSTQTISIVLGAIVLILLVVGVRLRKVNRGIEDGELLVTEGSFAAPDNAGNRREQALDIGNKENEMTSGSVDSAEIAAALAQSATILPPLGAPPSPSSGAPPQGLPPGLPSGLPPPISSKPLPPIPSPAPPTVAPPIEAFAAPMPPLPPGGLPAGWTMEQWKHYGAEWLKRQG